MLSFKYLVVIKMKDDNNLLKKYKKFSPAIFGIALISFFLPFISKSSIGQEVTISGIKIVFSIIVGIKGGFGVPEAIISLPIIVAFFSAIVGLWKSFKENEDKFKYLGIIGIVGSAGLLIFTIVVDSHKSTFVIINMKIGLWLSLISFLAATFINFYYHSLVKKGDL